MCQATSRQSSVEPVPEKSLPQPESQTQRSVSSGGQLGAETEYWSMGREGPVLQHVYSEVGQPENDYSEPLDSLGRLYTSPPGGETQRRSEVEELRWKLRRERFSEGSLGSFRQKENTSEADVRGKRKLSLGQFVRKLSRGSLMGEGRGDVVRGGGGGGERLSKLVNRLVGAGRLASQQVWLFPKNICFSKNCHDNYRHPGGFFVLGVSERRRLLHQLDPHLHPQA